MPQCWRCGRFDGNLTTVIVQRGNAYQSEEIGSFCTRCLALRQKGWEECHEEVADREGAAGPCERPAYGIRVDPESGSKYPVCRAHYRPPFHRSELEDQ